MLVSQSQGHCLYKTDNSSARKQKVAFLRGANGQKCMVLGEGRGIASVPLTASCSAKTNEELVATSTVLGRSSICGTKFVDASSKMLMVAASNEKQGGKQQPHIG